MRVLRLAVIVLCATAISSAQSPEEKTAAYLESVRHQPSLLLAFLQQMPKGGDLHVHLSGAIYAESMIDWASENALCVDRSTSKLIRAACDSCETYRYKPSVRCAYQDHVLYNQLIDAWSMRNWGGPDPGSTPLSMFFIAPAALFACSVRLPRATPNTVRFFDKGDGAFWIAPFAKLSKPPPSNANPASRGVPPTTSV